MARIKGKSYKSWLRIYPNKGCPISIANHALITSEPSPTPYQSKSYSTKGNHLTRITITSLCPLMSFSRSAFILQAINRHKPSPDTNYVHILLSTRIDIPDFPSLFKLLNWSTWS